MAVVVAPAGFGKTTLLEQWSGQAPGEVRWYSAEELTSGRSALPSLEPAHRLSGIVIDGMDRVASDGRDEALEQVVRRVARRVPVVLASRRMPAFNLACHEFPQSIFLTSHDLAFRPWEISELFADIYDDVLDIEEPLTLADRTGGWPAALHLWHLARRLSAPGSATCQLDTVHGLVRNYLSREVLAEVDPPTLAVMRRSSVLDVLTPERLDQLLGTDTAHRILSQIADCVDLVAVGSNGSDPRGGPRYTYHVVLRDYLRTELRADVGPAAARALHEKARDLAGPDSGVVFHREPEDRPPQLTPGRPSTRSLQLLAQGRVSCAEQLLARSPGGLDGAPALERPARLAAEMVLAALAALLHPHRAAPELVRAHDLAADAGLTWLRRVAHAVALCRTAGARGCAEARELAKQRRRAGDDWGACLIEGAVSLALLRHGRPDLELIDRLADDVRGLGVPALEAWARSAHAMAAADLGLTDGEEADCAAALARAADAPGALAVAYAALAAGRPGQRRQLHDAAARFAQDVGLGCRPWTWGRDGPPTPCTGGVHRGLPATPVTSRPHPPDAEPLGWAGLRFTCLGDFAVLTPGGPSDLPGLRPTAQTVLRILAVNAGRPVHRELLINALWADLPEPAALHNVHVSVSSLRHHLEALLPGRSHLLLARRGQTYVLAPGPVPVTDLQLFDRYVRDARTCRHAGDPAGQAEALRAALALYAGDVLAGDGSAEWVVPIRERYRLAAAEAAARLAELELARERAAAAVDAAHRSVQIDPYRDASWQLLIRAHLQAGRPVQAERAKHEYAAVLAELGVPSVPSTSSMPPGHAGVTAHATTSPPPATRGRAATGADRRPPGVRTA